MHNLVKEATGVDFNEFGDNVEAAKEVAQGILRTKMEDKSDTLLGTCPSVGHVLNEVNHISLFDKIMCLIRFNCE